MQREGARQVGRYISDMRYMYLRYEGRKRAVVEREIR